MTPETLATSACPAHTPRTVLTLEDYALGVEAGDRAVLARAITLVESRKPADQALARRLLQRLLPATGRAHRIGITGVPGVGKSTTIDQLGMNLIAAGHKVAVLAVDPTSRRTGGSILGDKTRMERLSQATAAFIRPSPTSGTLGGVARRTRETMALVEAAGFDVVIVETVGVGQSETDVANLTDVFVLMQLPNAGDDLQAIKKGIVELADIIAYNKRDLDPAAAERAMGQMASALPLLRPASAHWRTPVLGVSALHREGIDAFWIRVLQCRDALAASGELIAKRQRQALAWTWHLLDAGLRARFHDNPAVRSALPGTFAEVAAGTLTPAAAASRLLDGN